VFPWQYKLFIIIMFNKRQSFVINSQHENTNYKCILNFYYQTFFDSSYQRHWAGLYKMFHQKIFIDTHNRGFANTVKDMFDILFHFPPKSQIVKLVTHEAVKPRAVAVPIRISVRDRFET